MIAMIMHGTWRCQTLRRIQNQPAEIKTVLMRLSEALIAGRSAIVIAISALLGGGWYLARKGFGRQWRHLVVEELRKHGVQAKIGHLTLDPFRGLIAQDVRLYDYKNRENTLALISEVSLDINYAALL